MMKDSASHSKAEQALRTFESLGNIQPSAGWDQSLMIKLSSAKPSSNSRSLITGYTLILLFFVLMNIGFFLGAVIHDSHKSIYRNNELQIISNELLINPTSLNN